MDDDELLTPYERASRAVRAERADPAGDYAQGWRDAIDATMRCGAYNAAAHTGRGTFALCVRASEHAGRHDDTWMPWGDRLATPDQTRQDAVESSRAARLAWNALQEQAVADRTRALVDKLAEGAAARAGRPWVAKGPHDIPPGNPQGG